MSLSAATHKLRKLLLFEAMRELNKLNCFQCGETISSVDSFTVEHKVPWRLTENPMDVYFDLSNIAYSHHSCNSGAARKADTHPGARKYTDKERQCSDCHVWKPFRDSCRNRGKASVREIMCRQCRRESRRVKR
jgi:hypothetical protein